MKLSVLESLILKAFTMTVMMDVLILIPLYTHVYFKRTRKMRKEKKRTAHMKFMFKQAPKNSISVQ